MVGNHFVKFEINYNYAIAVENNFYIALVV